MSERFRDSYFAFGLAVGVITTLLLVAAENHFSQAYDAAQSAAQTEQEQPIWWLIPGIIFWEDTVAQWLMMVFTLFAVWLVYRTLLATRETLEDTRRIGEAQVRAYLSATDVSCKPLGVSRHGYDVVILEGVIENSGQSPSRSNKIRALVRVTNQVAPINEDDWGQWQDNANLIPAKGRGTYFVVDIGFPSGTIAAIKEEKLLLQIAIEISGRDVFEKLIVVREHYTTTGGFFEKGFLDQKKGREE